MMSVCGDELRKLLICHPNVDLKHFQEDRIEVGSP